MKERKTKQSTKLQRWTLLLTTQIISAHAHNTSLVCFHFHRSFALFLVSFLPFRAVDVAVDREKGSGKKASTEVVVKAAVKTN